MEDKDIHDYYRPEERFGIPLEEMEISVPNKIIVDIEKDKQEIVKLLEGIKRSSMIAKAFYARNYRAMAVPSMLENIYARAKQIQDVITQ